MTTQEIVILAARAGLNYMDTDDLVRFAELVIEQQSRALEELVEKTSGICEGCYGDEMDAAFDKARAAFVKT